VLNGFEDFIIIIFIIIMVDSRNGLNLFYILLTLFHAYPFNLAN